MDDTTYAGLLRRQMDTLGVTTQSELRARMAERGHDLHPSTVSKWLSGDRLPQAALQEDLLDCLEIHGQLRLWAYRLAGAQAGGE